MLLWHAGISSHPSSFCVYSNLFVQSIIYTTQYKTGNLYRTSLVYLRSFKLFFGLVVVLGRQLLYAAKLIYISVFIYVEDHRHLGGFYNSADSNTQA